MPDDTLTGRRDQFRHIIGIVDPVGAHAPPPEPKCGGLPSPWAELDAWHLLLANPRALDEPIPFRGTLGLRELDAATTARILEEPR